MKKLVSMKTCEEEEEQDCSFFPSDVIFEVLTRIPLGSLYKCRFVCEQWKQLTYDSHFLHQHRLRNQTVSGFFVQGLHYGHHYTRFIFSMDQITSPIPQPSLNFLPEEVKIEASSSHGLVCCVGLTRIQQYYICKPATREYKPLPNPRTRFFTETTALIVQPHKPFHFVILRLSRSNRSTGCLHCEIFFSHKWVWERSTDVYLPPDFLLISRHSMIAVKDRCYSVITNLYSGEYQILEYSINRRSWKTIQIPHEEDDSGIYSRQFLAMYRGQLSVLHTIDSTMEVWVLRNYSRGTWSKRRRMNFEDVNRPELFFSVMSLYTDEVAIMVDLYRIIWYNFQSRKYTEVRDDYTLPTGVYIYESDLVPHGMDWR